MTRDDIIRMAREAGVPDSWDLNWFDPYYERFANLVAEAEREACAALCFQMWDKWMRRTDINDGVCPDGKDCAAAIRARGQ